MQKWERASQPHPLGVHSQWKETGKLSSRWWHGTATSPTGVSTGKVLRSPKRAQRLPFKNGHEASRRFCETEYPWAGQMAQQIKGLARQTWHPV